jgi:D-beta-D-heptose 7-phosphate kinase/D-beta-D-heptose 1-phosphate adenosyltransferase
VTTLPSIIESWKGKKVVVVGDIILDTYLEVINNHRDDPAGKMAVYNEVSETPYLGGAANVAANLAAMGAKVCLVGLVGNDRESEIVTRLMDRWRIRNSVISAPGLSDVVTTTKTRVESFDSDFGAVRIDRVSEGKVSLGCATIMARELGNTHGWADGVLFSDYGHGAIGCPMMRRLMDMKVLSGDLTMHLDPHRSTPSFVLNNVFDCVTPNTEEFELLDTSGLRDDCSIVVTGGPLGADIVNGESSPTTPVEDPMVCGAGDVFAAALLLGRLAGGDWHDSLKIANAAGRAAVLQPRTSIVNATQILNQLSYVENPKPCDVY